MAQPSSQSEQTIGKAATTRTFREGVKFRHKKKGGFEASHVITFLA